MRWRLADFHLLPYILRSRSCVRLYKRNLLNRRRSPMKSLCDPNGIRTRVTAVKGRCPGPLDDRVTRAGQYQKCRPFTQGKLPDCFSDLLRRRLAPRLQTRIEFVYQGRGARSRALVLAQNLARTLDETSARFALAQKLRDRFLK
jgi:hypothetical protein